MGALLSSESSMERVQSLWEGGRLSVDESTASAWVLNRLSETRGSLLRAEVTMMALPPVKERTHSLLALS